MSNFFNNDNIQSEDYAAGTNYEIVRTQERINEVGEILAAAPLLAVDTENTGLDPHEKNPLLLQVATYDKCYVFDGFLDLDFSPLKKSLENPDIVKVLFQAKYDWKWIYVHYDIEMEGIFCCQIAERLLTVGMPGARRRPALHQLAFKYLGIELKKEARSGFIDRDPVSDPITEKEYQYSAADVLILPDIYYIQVAHLNKLGAQIAAQLEFDVLPIVALSEVTGVYVDQEKWRSLLKEAEQKKKTLANDVYKALDSVVEQKTLFGVPTFNIASQPQLLTNLRRLGFDLENTEVGTLKKYKGQHPAFDSLIKWRGYEKITSTYGEKLLSKISKITNRLHCQFNQVLADSGRMSSSRPNLQNIPAYDPDNPSSMDFRSCFAAKPGYELITADFSQQELRILADGSGDPVFRKAYTEVDENGDTLDVHAYTASVVFDTPYSEVTPKQRKQAKCVHPDTLVFSQKGGLRPIKSISKFSPNADTFKVPKEVVKVLGPSRSFYNVNQTYSGTREHLKVVCSNNGLVVCSNNHKFLLQDGSLVRAEDLKPGQMLQQAEHVPLKDLPFSFIPLEKKRGVPQQHILPSMDWAYFAGVFLGDGTASYNGASICIGNIDKKNAYGIFEYKQWAFALLPFLRSLGFNSNLAENKELISLGGRESLRIFRSLELMKDKATWEIDAKENDIKKDGLNSCKILRVPKWIMAAGKEACLNFLGGLIDSDGWVGFKKGDVNICTKDPVFAGQIVHIANCCGLQASISPSFNKKYKRWYWKIKISKTKNHIIIKYMKNPWRRSLVKCSNLNRSKSNNKVLLVTDYHRLPKKCVDINIDSRDHIYNTNGLLTHNTLNFALVYGSGAFSLAQSLKISEDEAQEIIDNYFKRYPKIKEFLSTLAASAISNGFAETVSGRKRFLPLPLIDLVSEKEFKKAKGSVKRQAQNNFMQGSGADVTKKAMIFVHRRLRAENLDAVILMIVHDELVVEVRKDQAKQAAKIIEEEMVRGFTHFFHNIPMKVDAHIGNTWEK